MKDLRTETIEKKSIEKMAECVSRIIDEIRDDIFLEGVFYIGSFLQPTINLAIVYNDYKFRFDYSNEERDEIIRNTEMDLRIETIAFWRYFNEQRKIERLDYPIEFMLRYGDILYDKNGNLTSLKKQLENDTEIESDLDYWGDACKFDPPLQLIKK